MRFSVLLPFFATFVLAAYFFYFQWTYTRFKSIDFQNIVLYGKDYIFSPTEDEYIIMFYNSKSSNYMELAQKIPNDSQAKIIAIDFYQNTDNDASDDIIPLSAGMNTLLKLSNSLKVQEIPVYFGIKRKSLFVFTQNSGIKTIQIKKEKK